MKLAILVLCSMLSILGSVRSNSVIDYKYLQQALSALPKDKIPDQFKNPRDNTNWCCKIDVPIQTLTQTRAVSSQYVNSQNVKCGSSSCGFLGLFKCTRWCTQYWIETIYHTELYTYTQQQPCPSGQEICCRDHFLILDHCFHISEVQQNLDLLAALNNQGIVLPIGK